MVEMDVVMERKGGEERKDEAECWRRSGDREV